MEVENASWEEHIINLSDLKEDYLTEIIMDNINKKMLMFVVMEHHYTYDHLLLNEVLMKST